MASNEVKLLGTSLSPFVLRARIALNLKSVDHVFMEVGIFTKKSDLFLKSNPVHKKMPILIHGDRPICESLIIVQYIDKVWASGPAILPSDPYDQATARFWAAYLDDKWYRRLTAIILSQGEEAKKAALEDTIQGLNLLEEAFAKCSKGKKFFGGGKIGYLDIALGSFVVWMRATQKLANVSLIDESKTPNLFKWAQDFSAMLL
ncbi:hypothetical protein BUALT_Bualt17G0058500 [Buddleja alternifolia]|uniref:Glutathione S-transferase n=1 Tax=Buddleja alternifolia TaxID=168488 RepID=A0AAV6W4G8_9LAMI|nr:hypothetical protein BUALT_Bualt17G0058500 [Buddleja alternifolia]